MKEGFSIKEITHEMAAILAENSSKNYTGSVRFELHFRDGGIGKVGVIQEQTLRKK